MAELQCAVETLSRHIADFGWCHAQGTEDLMRLFSEILPNTARAMAFFAIAAFVLAVIGRSHETSVVLRILIEFPLLLLLSSIIALLINGVAAACGTMLGGRALAAVLVSLALGWAVAGGGKSSFAGLGYHALLQPAFALSLGLPWLLKSLLRRT